MYSLTSLRPLPHHQHRPDHLDRAHAVEERRGVSGRLLRPRRGVGSVDQSPAGGRVLSGEPRLHPAGAAIRESARYPPRRIRLPSKVGLAVLVLGAMHFFNMNAIAKFGRKVGAWLREGEWDEQPGPPAGWLTGFTPPKGPRPVHHPCGPFVYQAKAAFRSSTRSVRSHGKVSPSGVRPKWP